MGNREIFSLLMRNLNEIAIKMPRKESEKVLYIMSQLENLYYYPNDIRRIEDYQTQDTK